MKATEFDERFDAGEDMSANVDWSRTRRLNFETSRVDVDSATWVVSGLDRQARVTRQELIKMWIADRPQ